MIRKIVGWLLIVHGIICTLGAFFPFYPPIFLFYFLALPFAVKLILVLLLSIFQIVFGVYLAFTEKLRQVRWYWPALTIIVIVILLLIYPALNYFFGI